MVTITELAAQKAKEALTAEGKVEWGLRLYMSGGGCCGPSFGMDMAEKAESGDSTVEAHGLKVFMDKATTEKLSGMEIDFVSDGENEGFVIKGGSSSCGPSCGSGCHS